MQGPYYTEVHGESQATWTSETLLSHHDLIRHHDPEELNLISNEYSLSITNELHCEGYSLKIL